VSIEALTYRRSMHTISDDPSASRGTEEEEWEARDPILRFQQYLEEWGILDEETTAEIDERIESKLADEINRAREEREAADPADTFRSRRCLPPPVEEWSGTRGVSLSSPPACGPSTGRERTADRSV